MQTLTQNSISNSTEENIKMTYPPKDHPSKTNYTHNPTSPKRQTQNIIQSTNPNPKFKTNQNNIILQLTLATKIPTSATHLNPKKV